jgi:hypothetical protein
MPGFRGYFRLPDALRTFAVERPEDEDSEDPVVFRVLGGVRIGMEYVPADPRAVSRFEWAVTGENSEGEATNGRFFESLSPGAGIEGDGLNGPPRPLVYWQSDEWNLDPERFDGTLTLHLNDEDSEPEEIAFVVERRELGPPEDENDEPMQGSDVAMLEEMLWQLGISPQFGWKGRSGTRIDEISAIEGLCDHAKPRDEFSAGWEFERVRRAEDDADLCKMRRASIEAMVRRFTARHETSGSAQGIGPVTLGRQTGRVDEQALAWMNRTWELYAESHSSYDSRPIINLRDGRGLLSSDRQDWALATVDIWRSGYQTPDGVPDIPRPTESGCTITCSLVSGLTQ